MKSERGVEHTAKRKRTQSWCGSGATANGRRSILFAFGFVRPDRLAFALCSGRITGESVWRPAPVTRERRPRGPYPLTLTHRVPSTHPRLTLHRTLPPATVISLVMPSPIAGAFATSRAILPFSTLL